MKITKQRLKQIIKEEVNDSRGSMLGGGASIPPASTAYATPRKEEKADWGFLKWADSLNPSPARPDFSISENVFNAFADVHKGDEAAAWNETKRAFSHGLDLENHDHQQMLHILASLPGGATGGSGWTPSGQHMADWVMKLARTGETRKSNIEDWEQKSLTGDWEQFERRPFREHLTKRQLKQMVKEELEAVLAEEPPEPETSEEWKCENKGGTWQE